LTQVKPREPEEVRAKMSDPLDAIRACRLWRDAGERSLARLSERARMERADRGRLLVAEGDPADRFGLIAEGRVRVFHLAADGRRFAYDDLEAPEPFAVPAVLSGGRYPASVEAATPVTIVWLTREALFEMLETEPGVVRGVVADLARRVVDLTSVAQSFSMDVPARLARFLFERALSGGQRTESGLLVDIGMSKAELAESLGAAPETLSRSLARLKGQGLIEVDGREVRLLDVGAIVRLGSGYEEG
jgi:CRP/FNR family transcriptional regulator